MDLNIAKVENNYTVNPEIYIKTEPIDNASQFLREASAFTEVRHQHEIKTEIVNANIKSEDLDVNNEAICDALYVHDHLRGLASITSQSSSENVHIEIVEEHHLDFAEEKLHEIQEYGESSRQHQSSVLNRPSQNNKTVKLICDECGKVFKYKSDLNRHLHIHSGMKPFECEVCNKTFNKKSNLVTHKFIHSGDKPYFCNQCDKQFIRNGDLMRHELTHTGVRPHKCGECGKAFTAKFNLIRHKRIHTGEKPYLCNICATSFSDGSGLNKHKRRAHDIQPHFLL